MAVASPRAPGVPRPGRDPRRAAAPRPAPAAPASAPAAPSMPAAGDGTERHDVVILGGGIVAASIAYYLTLAGVRPLVVERTGVACAASGKAGGFLAESWGDGTPTEALHRVSFSLHAQLASDLGLSSYRSVQTLSLRTAPGGGAAASRRGGPAPPAPWLGGADVAGWRAMSGATAQVTPLELTEALMAAAVRRGAELRLGAACGLDTAADGSGALAAVRLEGGGAPLLCRRCVVAMGPWSTLLEGWLPGMRVPMQGIKSSSVVYSGAELKAAVLAHPFALFCEEDSRFGTHLEVYPRSNGEVYVCGIGGSDYVGAHQLAAGGDTSSQAAVGPDPARVAAAREALAGMVPLTAGEAPLAQACMRPCAPDALPILGPVGGHEGVFLATGTNCWGILWAPAIGKAMAELLTEGKASCVDLGPFSPRRFAPAPAAAREGGRGRRAGTEAVGEQW